MKGPALLVLAGFAVLAGLGLLLLVAAPGGDPAAPESAAARPSPPPADLARPGASPFTDPAQADRAGARAEVAAAAEATAPPDTVATGFDPRALYATVVDGAARPVPEARITLLPEPGVVDFASSTVAPLARATTDAEGRFRFEGLEAFTPYRVWIEAGGFVPDLKRHEPGIAETYELARATTLAGRVVSDGDRRGAAGVAVAMRRLTWDGERFARFHVAVTDEDGAFALAGLPRGDSVPLYLCAPAAAPIERELRLEDGPTTDCELVLAPFTRIFGRVVDAAGGGPVEGASIQAGEHRLATSDAAGRIAIALAAGPEVFSVIEATADGWCRTRVELRAGHVDGTVPLEVPMVRGATVRGVVRDDEGRPLAGVRLYGNNRNARPVGLETPGWARFYATTDAFEVVSDDAGRFALTALVSGPQPLVIVLSHPTHGEARETVELPPTGGTREVALVLPRGGALAGTVTVAGEPVSATLTFRAAEGRERARSNDRGEYRMTGLPKGQGNLSARVEGSWQWSRGEQGDPVWIEPGETTRHDLDLAGGKVRIAGRVHDTAGAPVSGIPVHALYRDADARRYVGGSATTDVDGAYAVDLHAEPGLAFRVVTRRGPSRAEVDGVVAPADAIDLVLPTLGRLALTVTDFDTGDPVSLFELAWRRDGVGELDELGLDLAADARGVVAIELPEGVHDLLLDARGSGYRTHRLEDVRVVGDDAPPIAVRLQRGTTLRVEVAGAPETPGRLLLAPAGPGADDAWGLFERRRVYVSDVGRVEVRGVTPGRYVLTDAANRPGDLTAHPHVRLEVAPQDEQWLEVEWPAGRGAPDDGRVRKSLEALGYR